MVYGWRLHVEMKALLEAGLSKSAAAKRLGVNRRTVDRWRSSSARRGSRTPRAQKLDPYKGILRARLAAYPELTSQRLFEEVREAGYPGSHSRVRDSVRGLRRAAPPPPARRFETPPGHCQVDFGTFRTPWGRRHALVVVLGHARLMWCEFYATQTMATVMTGLERAFRYFGGVPSELPFDQMKAVVTSDGRAVGGTLVLNEFGGSVRIYVYFQSPHRGLESPHGGFPKKFSRISVAWHFNRSPHSCVAGNRPRPGTGLRSGSRIPASPPASNCPDAASDHSLPATPDRSTSAPTGDS